MGEIRNTYKLLVGKSEGKRPLGRPRRRWEDDIKMNIREIGTEGVDWVHLAQDGNWWRGLINTAITKRFQKMRGIS
jgi:hypothetical protein